MNLLFEVLLLSVLLSQSTHNTNAPPNPPSLCKAMAELHNLFRNPGFEPTRCAMENVVDPVVEKAKVLVQDTFKWLDQLVLDLIQESAAFLGGSARLLLEVLGLASSVEALTDIMNGKAAEAGRGRGWERVGEGGRGCERVGEGGRGWEIIKRYQKVPGLCFSPPHQGVRRHPEGDL